tara:strand:+ start:40 stop:798 length:759 start_codon:yes stop_codon:yes gene_type:complete
MKNKVAKDIYSQFSKKGDKASCTVVALAVSTNSTFEQASEVMEQAGRNKNRGFKVDEMYIKNPIVLGHRFKPVDVKGTTIKDFISKYPKGTYLVTKTHHAFVIKDSIIIDHTDRGSRTEIKDCFEVKSTKAKPRAIKYLDWAKERNNRPRRKSNKPRRDNKSRVVDIKMYWKDLLNQAKSEGKDLYITHYYGYETPRVHKVLKVNPTKMIVEGERQYHNRETDKKWTQLDTFQTILWMPGGFINKESKIEIK